MSPKVLFPKGNFRQKEILSMFNLSKTTTSNDLMNLGSASVVGFQIVRIGGFSVSSFTQCRCFNATHKATRHTTCRNIINQHNFYKTNLPRKRRNPLKFWVFHDPMKEVSLRGRMLLQLMQRINYFEDIYNEFSMRTLGFRCEKKVLKSIFS